MDHEHSDAAVDTHHHFVPDVVFRRLQDMAGGAPRLVNEHISITLDSKLRDPDAHLQVMDAGGIRTAVLTNSGLNFMGIDTCRQLNDGLAEVVRNDPTRFVTCAHLPAAAGAADELRRCIDELGIVAVALPTTQNGVHLDDPAMDPIWALAEAQSLLVMLHPNLLPAGAETAYAMDRVIERFTDTSRAVIRIMRSVTDRYPELRFMLSHCGGTMTFLKGRMAMFYEHADAPKPPELANYGITARQRAEIGLDRVFEERFRRLHVDTAGTGGWWPALKMAREVWGADRMLFGTDFPLEAKTGEDVLEFRDALVTAGFAGDELCAVEHANAAALFGLD